MKKKISRRNPYAKLVRHPRAPYKPQIIQSKKKSVSVADDMDWWFYNDYSPEDKNNNDETSDPESGY